MIGLHTNQAARLRCSDRATPECESNRVQALLAELSQERKIQRSNPECRNHPVKVSRGALAFFAIVAAFAISAVGAQDKVEKSGIEAVYDGLEQRPIGPYRDGRAVAVAGVEGDALTNYMGTAGGGVYKAHRTSSEDRDHNL